MPAPTPHSIISLSDVAALLGMVLGTAGFVMSLMNYLRDRPRVTVSLKWDMTEISSNKKFGFVSVANIGRRPIYISIAALRLPEGFKHSHLILKQSIPGAKLSEGDASARFLVDCDKLEKYSKRWRDVRGYAEDSAGRRYVSKKLAKNPVPSWAKTDE
jgi:hypothetical protein